MEFDTIPIVPRRCPLTGTAHATVNDNEEHTMFSTTQEIRSSNFLFSTALIIVLLAVTAGPSLAVPAYPDAAITVKQPDGSSLTIRPMGDEYSGHFVTSDGYTVIKNANGYYTFAEKSAEGRLIPGDIVATEPANRATDTWDILNTLPKGLAPANSRPLPGMQGAAPSFMSFKAAVTNQNVLVIVIQFPDVPSTYTLTGFEDLMNQPGYDTYGSVRDFYLENSYGQFDLNGTVVGWYTASHNHDFYGYNDGNNYVASAMLAKEAILAADAAGLDFSQFDNNNDGEVDGVFIVHSGPGAEVGYSDYPWSHSWGLAWAGIGGVTVDGKYLNRYTMQPEKHTLSSMVRIGVFCHEYGHAIGLPDLYDTDGGSIGVGSWCLMAGGSWNGGGKSPSHLSAWCKARLKFLSPINILIDTTDVLIPDVENNQVVYRLWTEGLTGPEYYLAEYRRKTGFDGTLPGCGLAIWHIDDTRTNNQNETHRWVDLIEADNSENNSAGDVWLNKTFDSLSTPAAISYANVAQAVTVTVNSATCETAGLMVNFAIGIVPSCCVGMRGNIDGDPYDEITVGDITAMVDYMFRGGQIGCIEEANVDGDALEEINIADLTQLVNFSFKSGNSPASCQ